jgi:hypothetical protein
MFEKENHKISDSEFLESFCSQNVLLKVATNLVLKSRLKNVKNPLDQHIKPLFLQILENYIYITETILMFLWALVEKKRNPDQTLLYHYVNVSIKEQSSTKPNTQRILDYLKDKSELEILDFLGLKNPKDIITTFDNEKLQNIKNKFETEDVVIKKAIYEFREIIDNIYKSLSNRIENAEGKKTDLYKIYNKLKHGAQYIDVPDTNNVYVISKVNSISSSNSNCEIFLIECNLNDAIFLAEQSKIIALSLERFITVISVSFEE